jgi:hypothetical protein
MRKTGRNEPCHCGSGKKYKHCCLDKDCEHSSLNPAKGINEELHNAIGERVFETIEEANDFLQEFSYRKNNSPMPDFFGLSPDTMHKLLNRPLEQLEDAVRFNHGLNAEAFKDIPIVKNAVYFLSRMKELQPMKATAKGNLPITFARDLDSHYDSLFSQDGFSIRSEEESPPVNGMRHILTMCGWIKKSNNRFSLTKKGDLILKDGFSESHFFLLLKTFTRSFNWAFMDRYHELRIIRDSFLFSLYVLHLKAEHPVQGKVFGEYFVKAFPMTLLEANDVVYTDPEEYVKDCFSLRFLERFCEYFGFINIKREKISPFGSKLFIKKSSFFDQYFDWSNISKPPTSLLAVQSHAYH